MLNFHDATAARCLCVFLEFVPELGVPAGVSFRSKRESFDLSTTHV